MGYGFNISLWISFQEFEVHAACCSVAQAETD